MENDSLGCRIATARTAQGYSRSQVARRLGVRQESIEKWESDHAFPRVNVIFKIAGILNATPAWLITGDGEPPGQPTSPAEEINHIRGHLEHAQRAVHELQTHLSESRTLIEQLQKTLAKKQGNEQG